MDQAYTLHELQQLNPQMHVVYLDIKAAYDCTNRSLVWDSIWFAKNDKSRDFTRTQLLPILRSLFDFNACQLLTLAMSFRDHMLTFNATSLNSLLFADDSSVFAKDATLKDAQKLQDKCLRQALSLGKTSSGAALNLMFGVVPVAARNKMLNARYFFRLHHIQDARNTTAQMYRHMVEKIASGASVGQSLTKFSLDYMDIQDFLNSVRRPSFVELPLVLPTTKAYDIELPVVRTKNIEAADMLSMHKRALTTAAEEAEVVVDAGRVDRQDMSIQERMAAARVRKLARSVIITTYDPEAVHRRFDAGIVFYACDDTGAASGVGLARVPRTAAHELGHCLAMDHCVYHACAMQGSASLNEDLRRPPYLCPVCLAKLARTVAGPPSLVVVVPSLEKEEAVLRACAAEVDYLVWLYVALRKVCGRWAADTGMFAAFDAWLGVRIAEMSGLAGSR
ncbi:hypothetical protein DFJ73DRAFT_779652 [Zopfochytrium polystomum]|nr:hypothetical protein DFJ73DRAFT_779652 [Zopfochytrium polystomum]